MDATDPTQWPSGFCCPISQSHAEEIVWDRLLSIARRPDAATAGAGVSPFFTERVPAAGKVVSEAVWGVAAPAGTVVFVNGRLSLVMFSIPV
ncbi:hypothetical protein Gain_0464_006 [Komagataeibacter intermedius TF2]|uniref:Uncharacterized protein n=1 Tax=Komagataeibacter intermedius NRIC 0521 TaxID=1307934 RepID=A0ABQ0PHW3_9PROT|nr:hypothetical protein Gain_0464_006 [Komagataeibacter intermedius TF2]GBQ69719.1 hypothetical protein AA0521_1529 [Komagataeibacter intermedius NRIC 0521]